MTSRKPTQRNLEQRLRYWQKRLRLQDWDITLEWAPRDIMKDDLGRTIFNDGSGYATIYILGPPYDPDTWPNDQNWELTLIHELMHLLLEPTFGSKRGHGHTLQELAIEKLARAYLEL